jgi:hypothetical protein
MQRSANPCLDHCDNWYAEGGAGSSFVPTFGVECEEADRSFAVGSQANLLESMMLGAFRACPGKVDPLF